MKDDGWVKQCMEIDLEGKSVRGNRKMWKKTVDEVYRPKSRRLYGWEGLGKRH